jgi:putative transcriptional regulator
VDLPAAAGTAIIARVKRALLLLAFVAGAACAEPPNGILLIARPELSDPNFRETVVLVTQAPDFHTVGVILNRPSERRHETTKEPLYFGGPVLAKTIVALYRSEQAPDASAFHVLKHVYLTMHPVIIEALLARRRAPYRLYAGFAGWAPGQLEAEMGRDGWYVLAPSEELVFRRDTAGMWNELIAKARGAHAENETRQRVLFHGAPAQK